MIFKEARGAVERFVADSSVLSAEFRARPKNIEDWAGLRDYLAELYAALDTADKATGNPGERGGPVFEFYNRGLARIREYARGRSSP